MTVKQLLNFIAIEIESGRLSEDADISVYSRNYEVSGRVVEIEVDEAISIDIIFDNF